jgi:hypothetical protein
MDIGECPPETLRRPMHAQPTVAYEMALPERRTEPTLRRMPAGLAIGVQGPASSSPPGRFVRRRPTHFRSGRCHCARGGRDRMAAVRAVRRSPPRERHVSSWRGLETGKNSQRPGRVGEWDLPAHRGLSHAFSGRTNAEPKGPPGSPTVRRLAGTEGRTLGGGAGPGRPRLRACRPTEVQSHRPDGR